MSTVIARNVQVGADGTASNNFTIYQPTVPDGTLRIGNGNSGTTSNLVTVTSAGNVGLGTTSPSYKQQIQSATTSSGATPVFNLVINRQNSATEGLFLGMDGNTDAVIAANNSSLRFGTVFTGAYTELARISNTGQRSTVIPSGSTLYPAYDCRAWVNFNGTGVVAIRASGNVTSITDNGTGDYTVNFTTAMADASYAVNVSWAVTATETGGIGIRSASARPVSSSSARVLFNTSSAAGNVDGEVISVAIFR